MTGLTGGTVVDIAVLVVTFNSARHLPGLLDSLGPALSGAGTWRLVVADNDSSDETLDLLARLCPAAIVQQLPANLGYAAGINAAQAVAGPARALLILNPDIRLGPGSVARLRRLATGSVGVMVPRLTDERGRLATSMRREPTVGRALGEALLGGRLSSRVPSLGEVVHDPSAYDRPTDCDWATGAALLVTAACADAVGPWNESYFLYSEETDFLLRARDCGFTTKLAPDAAAVHVGGQAHVSPELWSRLTVNRVRLYGSRHTAVSAAAFWAAVVVGEVLRALPRGEPHRAAVRALLGLAGGVQR